MTHDVCVWIVWHSEDRPPEFFASTRDETPEGMSEFVTEDSTVVKLGPEDVQNIALIWADAQG